MVDETRAEATADSQDSLAGSAEVAAKQAMPILATATTQISFAAATNQFNTLTQFGSGESTTLSIADRARVTTQTQKDLESKFIQDGAIEINANGSYHDAVIYAHAVDVIRAKAVALGYGAQSQTVPITSVPGGYVGRFGGNDIYAAAH